MNFNNKSIKLEIIKRREERAVRNMLTERCISMCWLDSGWQSIKGFLTVSYEDYLNTLSDEDLLNKYEYLKAIANKLD